MNAFTLVFSLPFVRQLKLPALYGLYFPLPYKPLGTTKPRFQVSVDVTVLNEPRRTSTILRTLYNTVLPSSPIPYKLIVVGG